MKRMNCNSVTDALMSALEEAGEMETIIILYEKRKDVPEPRQGFIVNEECDLKNANYLLDAFKAWMFRPED